MLLVGNRLALRYNVIAMEPVMKSLIIIHICDVLHEVYTICICVMSRNKVCILNSACIGIRLWYYDAAPMYMYIHVLYIY